MKLRMFPVVAALLRFSLAGALLVLATTAAAASSGDVEDYPLKDTAEASILRGDIVYHSYCALCHGMNADGRGRAARIYNPRPVNLRKSLMNNVGKEMIIRKGGKAMGRSEFMPPWGEELTDEQIADVVHYLRTIAPTNAPR